MKSFMPWAFLQLHGYVGAKGWRAHWRNPHVLSESKSWYRNRSWFFSSMCCLSWKWKGVPEAGWICSHGRRLVDGAHLSQTAKHHNGKKGWWRKIVGGFSTFCWVITECNRTGTTATKNKWHDSSWKSCISVYGPQRKWLLIPPIFVKLTVTSTVQELPAIRKTRVEVKRFESLQGLNLAHRKMMAI